MAKRGKITAFLSSTSSGDPDSDSDRSEHRAPRPKITKHCRNRFDVSWNTEFPWLRYVPDDASGPSMYCTLCQKHNMNTSRKVWISVPFNHSESMSLRTFVLITSCISVIMTKINVHPVKILPWGKH